MPPYHFIQKYLPQIYTSILEKVKENFDGETTPSQVYSSLFEYLSYKFETNELNSEIAENTMLVIEDTLEHGDEEFKTAASLSFLEDLTNNHFVELYKYMLPFFGKYAKAEVQRINNFWDENISK